ncbi:MAG: alpha/beta hydrolase [bacterium]|nr:alpha/beta hydrolase [bacterium]
MENPHSQYSTIALGPDSVRVRFRDQGEGVPILYLHGWGTSLDWFLPLMDSLLPSGRHLLLDFPGFGESERPQSAWGTEAYAELIRRFLVDRQAASCIVIGHSFGGRVAIRLAHRYPDLVKGLVLIAAAGLRRKVPFWKRLKIQTIRKVANGAKAILPGQLGQRIKDGLYAKIASRDYLQAGAMRPIFVKVVNEDLAPLLQKIQTPSLLLWGSDDTETPPSMGKQMKEYLAHARYLELPGFDHYTILSRAQHQVGYQIQQFMKGIVA